nr:hypothetical protein [Tanacetum cinerariifolium]
MDNPDPRVYVVDGKPLKSILKRPKTLKSTASGSKQHGTNLEAGTTKEDAKGAVYNKKIPCLGTNKSKSASTDKGADGKPFQVRRKVAIAHNESKRVWEFNETEFVSPSRNVKVVEYVTCNKPSQEVPMATEFQSDANEVNESSPQIMSGSYASVIHAPNRVDSNTNDGYYSGVYVGSAHVETRGDQEG